MLSAEFRESMVMDTQQSRETQLMTLLPTVLRLFGLTVTLTLLCLYYPSRQCGHLLRMHMLLNRQCPCTRLRVSTMLLGW